jgi:hypothetical protein
MSGFAVTPGELEAASATLGSVQGELACPTLAPGDLGSPELEAAMSAFYSAASRVAVAMGEAVTHSSAALSSGAALYVTTDAGAMPAGR